jgi:site-specific DNA-methyltransferase (adenine-specific)
MNKVHLADCMDIMRKMPDKSVDLCIVDPPYGIDVGNMTGGAGKNKQWEKGKCWDKDIPNEAYFIELSRISKNQIIWGGNYFPLPPTKCFLIWDKKNDGRDFAECELAWSSFDSVARMFRMRPMNMDGGKIHPTQKPVALYKWLLKNYAKPGDKIFDSHVGSGSSRIACYDMGFDFEGCEIDKDYWEAQEKRYNQHIMQGDLFSSEDTQKAIYQGVLF